MLSDREISEILKDAGREYGVAVSGQVGLNSDWSVSAWLVGPGRPNRTSGSLYILDGEEGYAELVRRRYPDDPAYEGDGYNDDIDRLDYAPLDEEGLRGLVREAANVRTSRRKNAAFRDFTDVLKDYEVSAAGEIVRGLDLGFIDRKPRVFEGPSPDLPSFPPVPGAGIKFSTDGYPVTVAVGANPHDWELVAFVKERGSSWDELVANINEPGDLAGQVNDWLAETFG